jgi:transcriptional regulator with PAS, ATPase and Fis domain
VATALPIKDMDGNTFLIVAYAENNSRIISLEKKLEEAHLVLQKNNSELSFLLNLPFHSADFVGESVEILKVRKLLERVTNINANVLLTGETGVGKSLFAKKIHWESERRDFPFVEINCAAIPPTLIESELFGYDKGAFTGASDKGKRGQIEMADGGTLFLDEISELRMDLQAKLLKVIQDKSLMRIGGTKNIKVDFRLIAASNKDLKTLVDKGQFRADLYYRLSVIPIEIPALRKRREDIPLLAKHFLGRYNEKYYQSKYFNRDAIVAMKRFDWPGNVREMENTIERLVLTVENNEIRASDIPCQDCPSAETVCDGHDSLNNALRRMEIKLILEEYKKNSRNLSATARALGISRQSLIRRLEKYAIIDRG